MNKYVKTILLMVIDAAILMVSSILACLIANLPLRLVFVDFWYYNVASVVALLVASFGLGMYKHIWKYAGVGEVIRAITIVLFVVAMKCLITGLTHGVISLGWAFVSSFIFAVGMVSRFSLVVIRHIVFKKRIHDHKKSPRTIIIGGGDAGSLLIKEIMSSDKIDIVPVCILDDDPNKIGQSVNGVKVVGKSKEVVKYAKNIWRTKL